MTAIHLMSLAVGVAHDILEEGVGMGGQQNVAETQRDRGRAEVRLRESNQRGGREYG
jgi:hypothetical protein